MVVRTLEITNAPFWTRAERKFVEDLSSSPHEALPDGNRLKEVSYHSQSKAANGRNRRYVRGLRSDPVSRGGHRRLACRVGVPGSALWFHHRSKPMVAQAQPWIADGTHDRNWQTRSAHLG